MTEKTHARFNASSSERWINCPASLSLIESLPFKPEPGPAAVEGTRLHGLCEIRVKKFLDYKITGLETPLPRMSEEDTEIVEGYVEAVWKEVLHESVVAKAYGTEELVVIDEQLDIWGTCDFFVVYINSRGKRVGAIVDFKSGFHDVEIKNNFQMKMYALGLLKELRKAGKDLDILETWIYQPKRSTKMKFCSYTSKQIEKFEAQVYKAVKQIINGKPKFKVGSYCGFCPAQAVCPTYANHNQELTSLALVDAEQIQFPTPQQLSDTQLAKIGLNADAISDFCTSCKMHCIERAKAGATVAGTKVIKKEGRRKWVEDSEKVAEAIAFLGQDAYEPKLIAIGKAEKLCGKGKLDSVITKSEGGFELAPDTDPRDGIEGALKALEE